MIFTRKEITGMSNVYVYRDNRMDCLEPDFHVAREQSKGAFLLRYELVGVYPVSDLSIDDFSDYVASLRDRGVKSANKARKEITAFLKGKGGEFLCERILG